MPFDCLTPLIVFKFGLGKLVLLLHILNNFEFINETFEPES